MVVSATELGESSTMTSTSPQPHGMSEDNHEQQQYFSNESLEDRNSTTSSTEGSINVERRKVSAFIVT